MIGDAKRNISPWTGGNSFVRQPAPAIHSGMARRRAPTPISPPFGCTGSLGRNTFTRPKFAQVDLRVSRKFYFSERWDPEFMADAFNLFNRFNVADVSPLSNPLDPATCRAGEPTAALDPRQFQFALKINW